MRSVVFWFVGFGPEVFDALAAAKVVHVAAWLCSNHLLLSGILVHGKVAISFWGRRWVLVEATEASVRVRGDTWTQEDTVARVELVR